MFPPSILPLDHVLAPNGVQGHRNTRTKSTPPPPISRTATRSPNLPLQFFPALSLALTYRYRPISKAQLLSSSTISPSLPSLGAGIQITLRSQLNLPKKCDDSDDNSGIANTPSCQFVGKCDKILPPSALRHNTISRRKKNLAFFFFFGCHFPFVKYSTVQYSTPGRLAS